TQTSREDEITRVNNPVGEDGRAVFRALRPGVEFELTVHGASSDDVLHQERVPPLAADESRHMVVELGDGLRVFRGHVLDQAGLPLVRAHLQHGNQILGWTDDAGAFAAYVTTAEPKTLLVSHDTCATIYLEEYLIPSDGQPVEFRLDPGYTVVIEVVDEDGAPVLGAEVRTRKKGFTTNTLDLGGGRHQASRLSADPIQIGTRVMGLSLTQDHDPAMPVARVVVPTRSAGGKVVVALTGAREWPEAWIYMLMLHPRGVEGAESQRIYPLRPDDGPFEFAFVVPGTYRATLFAFPPPGAENQDYEDIADVELEVELGRTTRVELDVTPR
ncbi:MAG: hypothetical protein ISR76_10605, partial [Planctomycetes bacterium]|nr:hypothetical protein [Planctomycetota bacterium]